MHSGIFDIHGYYCYVTCMNVKGQLYSTMCILPPSTLRRKFFKAQMRIVMRSLLGKRSLGEIYKLEVYRELCFILHDQEQAYPCSRSS